MNVKIDADEWRVANQELATLRLEKERLREALIKYGSHSETCDSHHQDRNTMGMGLTRRQCNCGFEQALKG